ncbi:unnamed protein product [Phytophthora lilii]|uniref:Unnamed protein product n=1 Tax=Phytophthora lilii TaxID=2077276 RepID=A0A9W6U857_9STRA|nr:unnamed protein product [Phytophthora lilii]
MGPLSPHPAVTTPPKPVNLATNTSTKCKAVAPLDNIGGSARQNTGARQTNTRLKSRLRNLVGFLFLLYGVGCIVYTVNSIRVSQAACMSYPTCVQFAYQWVPGAANDVCACLAHVDREMAPADSDNLTDVTQTLAELASAGKLQTVQLVNRKINGSLPEELEACQGLRNIVLIHTGVEEFPSWASTTFTQLEYLYVTALYT